MNFKVNRKEFVKVFQIAAKVKAMAVELHSHNGRAVAYINVDSCVNEARMQLYFTIGDAFDDDGCEVPNDQKGYAIYNRKSVGSIVKALLADEIVLECADDHGTVDGIRFDCQIHDALSNIPTSGGPSFTLDKKEVKHLIEHMSKDEYRGNITQVHVDKDGVIATDGHRMLHYNKNTNVGEDSYNIPREAMLAAASWLGTKDLLSCTSGVLFADSFLVEINSEDSYSKFPDYRMVLDQAGKNLAVYEATNAKDIVANLKAVIAAAGTIGAVASISEEHGFLMEGRKLPIQVLQQESEELGFRVNPTYLSKAMAVFDKDEVTIEYKGEMSPIILSDLDDTKWVLVMPMRL